MTPALLALAVSAAAPGPRDAPSLVGTWVLESSVTGGEADDHPPGITWTFTADGKSVIHVPDGRAGGEGTFTTDPKASPARFDVVDGAKEKAIRGIYKVEGDTLTLCIIREADRPTRFESPAGATAQLITLKRTMKKE